MTKAEKNKKRYHEDAEYRDRVKSASLRWMKENRGRYPDATIKSRLKKMKDDALDRYISKHERLLNLAKSEYDRRRAS